MFKSGMKQKEFPMGLGDPVNTYSDANCLGQDLVDGSFSDDWYLIVK